MHTYFIQVSAVARQRAHDLVRVEFNHFLSALCYTLTFIFFYGPCAFLVLSWCSCDL